MSYNFQKNKSKDNSLKLWELYCQFTSKEIIKNQNNLIAINHFFLSPVKPTYYNLKILNNLESLSIKDILKLKFKFYIGFLKLFLKKIQNFKTKNIEIFNSTRFKNYDYMIVTHLNNKDRLNSPFDPYYGNLLEVLIKNKKKILLVFIPHINLTRLDKQRFKKIKKPYDIYFLSNDFPGSIVNSKIINLFLNERKRLLERSKLFNGFIKNLYIYSAETIISDVNQRNWNYANELYKIIKHCSTKNLITTYEGHSWERLFYYFSKKANSSIRCIGYQHTLLFEYNHSILREISSLFDPDLILASGDTTLKLLNKKLTKKIRIELLGSHKHKINHKNSINISNNILFLPSGEFEEAFNMTNFAINYAKFNPKMNIIIRYHPVIQNKFNNLKEYKNFKKSNTSILRDCKNSRWAVYSSSTAIFEAIQLGCLPIKLNIENLISINDPLWQINSDLKTIIKNKKQLSLFIDNTRYKQKFEKSLNQKYCILNDQINNLSSSLNIKILEKDFKK